MQLDHQVTPHTSTDSKWIKYSNISHEAINIIEENIGSKMSDVSPNNIFADISSRTMETKGKI